jgi:anthranilate synthase component 1
MTDPSFKRFAQLARGPSSVPGRSTRIVPVWRDVLLDTDTPVTAFAKLKREPFAFLLESAPAGGETWARYTFLGTEPRSAWRLKDGTVEDWDPSRGWHSARMPADPLADLDELISQNSLAHVPELGRFWSGAVGYFAYDIVRLIERLPHRPPASSSIPDAIFVFTSAMVIIDNLKSQARIVVGVETRSTESDSGLTDLYAAANHSIDTLEKRLRAPGKLESLSLKSPAAQAVGRSSISRESFIDGVEKIREHIRAGDCFQALLARRIELDADFDPVTLYRCLRALNPSPYMYHLVLDGVEIIGSSPELLVRLEDSRITVRPIAGTRPRGPDAARDDELSTELLADPKERAEHIMLVDLGRNDVGRVSRFGSVEVSELMRIEKYSHVLHIVSQVEGTLDRQRTAMDVFRATFPAGTMTGAPKVRAMEIVDDLEPVSRGAYAGAIGFIAGGGSTMELAITIRTCVIADGVASVQAGAGIVADSVPETEWEETESKARALLSAIGQARATA